MSDSTVTPMPAATMLRTASTDEVVKWLRPQALTPIIADGLLRLSSTVISHRAPGDVGERDVSSFAKGARPAARATMGADQCFVGEASPVGEI
jgi:hypothetical protein